MFSTRFLARGNGSSKIVIGNVIGCGAAGSKGLTAVTASSCGGTTASLRCLTDLEALRQNYPRKKRLSGWQPVGDDNQLSTKFEHGCITAFLQK